MRKIPNKTPTKNHSKIDIKSQRNSQMIFLTNISQKICIRAPFLFPSIFPMFCQVFISNLFFQSIIQYIFSILSSLVFQFYFSRQIFQYQFPIYFLYEPSKYIQNKCLVFFHHFVQSLFWKILFERRIERQKQKNTKICLLFRFSAFSQIFSNLSFPI